MSLSLLKLPDVIKLVGYGRSSIYSKIRRGDFPPPVRLGERSVAWSSEEIDAWIRERITASRCTRERTA
jgi:prophage regulatory protein